MSFGGGGGGVAGVTAHKHTNAAGEGGSLDSTSLINDIPLFPLTVAL
jgi:hypothetical protein|tara:strand:+ start:318 stop:458 length:141 start_codon:yes stop_codon:yes gene_type:complete